MTSLPFTIAVLDEYQGAALLSANWTPLLTRCAITFFDKPMGNSAQMAEALRGFDAVCLMRERTAFSRVLFEALPRLKLLAFSGLANRAVDLAAAADHGVVVCHTRSGDTQHGTSEMAWALILAATRNLPLEDRRVRAGRWQTTIGGTLHGKTLGLLGLGRVGAAVARIGAAFGMKTIAWSPNLTAARTSEGGAELTSKDELFARADVLSVHLVLAEATRGIAGARELALMKPGALLVNTARAGLVDEPALLHALQDGRIGAALDVFEQEPLAANHPLLSLDNVVLSPHLGYVTRESYRMFYGDMVESIAGFLNDAPVRVVRAEAAVKA